MNRGILFGLAMVTAICILSSPASADTLVLKDGRTLDGKVVSEDDRTVVFEVQMYGAKIAKTFRRAEVEEIKLGAIRKTPEPEDAKPEKKIGLQAIGPEPEAPPVVQHDGPTYYIVPFQGEVGTHVLAEYLERCFEDAARRKPDVVILLVDSPGGYVYEVEKLVEVLRKFGKEMRIVAVIRKALSAAAISALACDEIYCEPGALYGAATAYKMNEFGMPSAVSEKFDSIWRATARKAARAGGHDPRLAEAMIDRKLELSYTREKDGKVTIHDGKKRGAKLLIAKDKLLTLTAEEARECGLSRDTIDDLDHLGEKLTLTGWKENKGLATLLSEHRKKAMEKYHLEMDNIGAVFRRHMQTFEENHPEYPSIPYRYYTDSTRFTPESKRRWMKKSRAAATALLLAEKELAKAVEMAGSFAEMEEVCKYLESLQEELKATRIKIARDINKPGPDG